MPPKNSNGIILVVDDDEMIRWTLREALQSWGFATVEASSAAVSLTDSYLQEKSRSVLFVQIPRV